MKKRIAIISVLITILLMAVVSASLVSYLSNIITGTVEVKGPVFYLDGHISQVYYNLFINEIPSEEEEVYILDGERIVFASESLEVDGFYKAKFDIHIWAKTNKSGNFMQFEVLKIDEYDVETTICFPETIEIGAIEYFTHYVTSCSSDTEISMNPEDRFGLEIHGVGPDSEYWIMTGREYPPDGYTRMEMDKA